MNDNYLERILTSEFWREVLIYVEPEDLKILRYISKSIHTLVSKIFLDNMFCRMSFERELGHKFPSQHPGKTSWSKKYKMITRSDENDWYISQYRGYKVTALLCSNELMDVQLAYDLLNKLDYKLSYKDESGIIYYALTLETDNEDVIKFLAIKPIFKMKDYLKDESINWLGDISILALKTIIDPSLNLF